MLQVKHSDLVIGLKVQDNDGNIGKVKDCSDIHNVYVEYDNGGSEIHCLVEDCKETTIINGDEVKIDQFDPLFFY